MCPFEKTAFRDRNEPAAGSQFDLLDFIPPLRGTFSEVKLPDLAEGLTWDTAMLYTTGVIKVVRTP